MEPAICLCSPCCTWDRFCPQSCCQWLCCKFLFTNERNCTCCPCPYRDEKDCQFCHCTCSENPNCHWCCCSCANNPNFKYSCFASSENTVCQYYESRCCRRLSCHFQEGGLRSIHTSKTVFFYKPGKTLPGTNLLEYLVCPACYKLRLHSYILPCNHCLCEKCIFRLQGEVEITESFFILVCPLCNKAHCLPYSNQMHLPENYLKGKLVKKYMQSQGFLKWRFDRRLGPAYCDVCKDRTMKAHKRCATCRLNFCTNCLTKFHSDLSMQDHVFTDACPKDAEEKKCIHHRNTNITEYCRNDNELLCIFCKEAFHNGHDTLNLLDASSEMAAALFGAIAKFKAVRYDVDNHLMDFSMLKTNSKTEKGIKRKEIRNGFLKLRHILQEQEKIFMETLENIDGVKLKEIENYISMTTTNVSQMDRLIAYCKEALMEPSQVAFLQSAKGLVDEIENRILTTFQPNLHLKEDQKPTLFVDFKKLADSLYALFPTPAQMSSMVENDKSSPYPYHLEMMEPQRGGLSNHSICSEPIFERNSSLSSLPTPCDPNRVYNEMPPGIHSPLLPRKCEGIHAYWLAPPEVQSPERNCQNCGSCHTWHSFNDEVARVPGSVLIYQTLVYPRAAKIYWTCPMEDVDYFEMEFYELINYSPSNTKSELSGQISDIKEQHLELHNLTPNTEYLFKVRAVNDNGPGQWSDICKVITPDGRGKCKGKWGLLRNIQYALYRHF
ncbi:tripartite motif-containing protein 42 [Ornithorhynchus anatinus]|uniref:Tripartite motif containing 42 n=1 Tax=Ornithorhynchus anatinus TaxID=9258 RepID=A0A6I8NF01_ORNAN|nr:tripartite motif-containing protein 42 [Ornithorhynchus anatinus]